MMAYRGKTAGLPSSTSNLMIFMEFIQLTGQIVSFLFAIAFIAGLLDTLAGGGGLIVLPALILSGIPPHFALGTNKLQGTMGTATATVMMLRKRRVRWHEVKTLMLAAFCGSIGGTITVQFINTVALSFVIPLVLVAIALYFLISPQPKPRAQPLLSSKRYQRLVVPAIGWYDGMFGPGTGSFFALAGVSLRSLGLIDATAVAKTLNFATNFGSLLIFLGSGKIVWVVGLLMMAGQFLGAWVGSHALLRINPKYLRLLVVAMCTGMLIKYFLRT
jgi:uncharacterized membrane protein YfcA